MDTKKLFISHLLKEFPGLSSQSAESLISENLISPFNIDLHPYILEQAKSIIASIYKMRELKEYQKIYSKELDDLSIKDPGNKSIMMSYDFHLDSNNQLKLIEINTNAAFLVLGYYMYQALNKPISVPGFSIAAIKSCIEEEMRLQGKVINASSLIAIIDDKPETQRLFIEFLVCKELFQSWGWKCSIEDFRAITLGQPPDFIYNRYTDFFLNSNESKTLKQLFLEQKSCLSPNPYEYFLLADKQRMIEWSSPGFLEKLELTETDRQHIKNTLPATYDMGQTSPEFLWSQRKHLFFKPKRAYGSKQSYKGASMSKKAFDSVLGEEFLAQEYVPAPEKTFSTPTGLQNFKFDLRCYAYQGKLQLVVARLYQGQVTNLKTQYGGFATVEFK